MTAMAAVAARHDAEDPGVGLWSSERAFRIMGTDAHVLVWQEANPLVAPGDLLDLAEAELARLEQLWSRFRPDSDVARVSAAAGTLVPVAPDTITLLELARRGHEVSGGCFDPTLLRELEAAGYDRTFEAVAGFEAAAPDPTAVPQDRGRAGDHGGDQDRSARGALHVDRGHGTAGVDEGCGLDLGGIAKGRAADVVAARLVQEGALGVCVNLGGDLRVIGETAPVAGIFVGVDDVLGSGRLRTVLQVRNAAVATSSSRRRAWRTATGVAHHLIDPASGRPATTGLAGVTVIAPTAAWAEVAATTAFLRGPSAGVTFLEQVGFAGFLVTDDGSEIRVADMARFER